jgi:CheY-like chemotaxis protein
MPGISGWEVAEAIKRDLPDLPVVMITGWGAQVDPERLRQSGVDRVLAKPFQWPAVRDTIQGLLGEGRG